jgi:hypothetical protein
MRKRCIENPLVFEFILILIDVIQFRCPDAVEVEGLCVLVEDYDERKAAAGLKDCAEYDDNY